MAMHACVGFEQLTGLSSAKALQSIPAGAHYAWVQAEAQAVRYRLDGTDPTTAIGGRLLVTAEQPLVIADVEGLRAAKFIEETATAKLNVHYFGNSD